MNNSRNKLNIRERIFKWFFIAGDSYRSFASSISGLCRFIVSVTLSLFILGLIFYLGFGSTPENLEGLKSAFRIMFVVIFFAKYIPGLLRFRKEKGTARLLRVIVFVFSLGVFLSNFGLINFGTILREIFIGNIPVVIAIILIGISEVSGLLRMISSVKIPPALIFSASFLLIIFIGSGLLMMPRAHAGPLSWLDSLFTSVSAVCVTGLVVVDTATAFTTLGKIIILCLIQIGGLGIMTFTGFFSFIFTSGSSFRDNLLLKELFSAETMNNLLKLLTKILLLTFLIEIIGALIIYSSLETDHQDKLLFSVFHSVSAFCNAGFSTLTGNLYASDVRFNNTLHISIALLIILGGIGFPVLMSFYSRLKYSFAVMVRKLQGKFKPVNPVRKDVAASIVMFMTALLVIGGTIIYYLFESENSLKGNDNIQKIIISFFGSVSSRTAGFNISDLTLWSYPTVFLMILLMWIGASPGSTGGGIKTTTFALAFRTAWNNIRGKERIKISNREISNSTISRVLSIVFLSLMLIGGGFFCLLLTEPGKDPAYLLFECFSAYGTVGLSIADSGTFSSAGKIVDMILMFVGRVGPLTLFTGLLVSYRKIYSKYPEVDLVIN
jgi:trk system potassium uptake protein TrkH